MKKAPYLKNITNIDGAPRPGEYHLGKLSGEEHKIATRILNIIPDEGFYSYRTITDLEKKIILRYWQKYDNMPPPSDTIQHFIEWFTSDKATSPERIRRRFKDLHSDTHHLPYIIIKPEVLRMARGARKNYERNLGYTAQELF